MARRRLSPAQSGFLNPAPALDGAGLKEEAPAEPRSEMRPAPIAQVSGQSAEAAALREMSQALQSARDEGRMVVDVPLSEIAPGYLMRDRMQVDPTELEALKSSIRAFGQRVPAEITPLSQMGEPEAEAPSQRYGLISGWRRLTALKDLQAETGEARFGHLRALIRPAEAAAESYVAMVEENEIRVGLSYYERARLVADLTKRGVFPDQSAAVRTLFGTASKAKRSKIVSFIDIHEALGAFLRFPAEIPERLGLALVSRLRQLSGAERAALCQELERAAPDTAEAERALLEKLSRPPKASPVSHAKPTAERIASDLTLRAKRSGRTITLTLSGEAADEALLERALAALRPLGTG